MIIKNVNDRPKVHKNIDGTYSKETKRVGFCSNLTHRGYLTKNLMKEHECIEKNCPYFIKYEKNSYWIQKEASREKRKKAKQEKKYWEQKEIEVLSYIRFITKSINDFCITSATRKNDSIEIRYVSLNLIDLYCYKFMTEEKFNVKCIFSPIKTESSKKKELIDMFINNPDYITESYDFELITKEEIALIESSRENQKEKPEKQKEELKIKKAKQPTKKQKKVIAPVSGKKLRGYRGYPQNIVQSTKPNTISELLNSENTDFEIIDFCDDSVFLNKEDLE